MLLILRVLNACSSIYDSLAQDYTGEAKGELSRLTRLLEGWSDEDFPTRSALIAACQEATSLVRSGDKAHATCVLLGHSNELWRQVLAE